MTPVLPWGQDSVWGRKSVWKWKCSKIIVLDTPIFNILHYGRPYLVLIASKGAVGPGNTIIGIPLFQHDYAAVENKALGGCRLSQHSYVDGTVRHVLRNKGTVHTVVVVYNRMCGRRVRPSQYAYAGDLEL